MKTIMIGYDAKADGSGVAHWSDGSTTTHTNKNVRSWPQ